MTTIHSLLNNRVPDPASRDSGNLAQQKTKWLRELERAQWQKQTVSHSRQGGSRNEADGNSQDTVSPACARCTAQQNEAETASTSTDPQAPRTQQAQEASHLAHASDFIASKQILDCMTPAPSPQLLPISPSGAMAANRTAPVAAELGAMSIDRRWEKQHAHLEEKDDQLHLWLRDTRIDESQGIALAHALKERFAELGKRLARFTLNGKSLQLEPATQQPDPSK